MRQGSEGTTCALRYHIIAMCGITYPSRGYDVSKGVGAFQEQVPYWVNKVLSDYLVFIERIISIFLDMKNSCVNAYENHVDGFHISKYTNPFLGDVILFFGCMYICFFRC
jgi:hypothetical protein